MEWAQSESENLRGGSSASGDETSRSLFTEGINPLPSGDATSTSSDQGSSGMQERFARPHGGGDLASVGSKPAPFAENKNAKSAAPCEFQ